MNRFRASKAPLLPLFVLYLLSSVLPANAAAIWICTVEPPLAMTVRIDETDSELLMLGINGAYEQHGPERYQIIESNDDGFIGITVPAPMVMNVILLNKRTNAFHIIGLATKNETPDTYVGKCKRDQK